MSGPLRWCEGCEGCSGGDGGAFCSLPARTEHLASNSLASLCCLFVPLLVCKGLKSSVVCVLQHNTTQHNRLHDTHDNPFTGAPQRSSPPAGGRLTLFFLFCENGRRGRFLLIFNFFPLDGTKRNDFPPIKPAAVGTQFGDSGGDPLGWSHISSVTSLLSSL